MLVGKILEAKTSGVSTIQKDVPVSRAVYRMVIGNIGALVVTEDGERIDGVISERDVVRGLESNGERLLGMKVGDVMSTNVPICTPDQQVARVMEEMTRSRQRHLPVAEDGKLVGIVSIGDLVKHRLDEMKLENNVLREMYIAKH